MSPACLEITNSDGTQPAESGDRRGSTGAKILGGILKNRAWVSQNQNLRHGWSPINLEDHPSPYWNLEARAWGVYKILEIGESSRNASVSHVVIVSPVSVNERGKSVGGPRHRRARSISCQKTRDWQPLAARGPLLSFGFHRTH